MQILSVNGYALFSHCIVLFLATFIHTGYDHVLFYGLWIVVSGIAALRLALIIMSRTVNTRYRFLLSLFVLAMHMFYLLYLHFAYHALAETVAHALNNEQTIATELAVQQTMKSVVADVEKPKAVPREIRTDISNVTKLLFTTTTTIVKQ